MRDRAALDRRRITGPGRRPARWPRRPRLDDPRLRVIRIEHGGVAQARNAGIAEARGEYLRFIDADDVIEPASTSLLLELCEGRGDVIAYGATMFCDEDLRPLWKMTSEVEGDGVTACLLGRFQTRVTAFLFPRRVIELTGALDQDFEVSADWDFILRVARARAGARNRLGGLPVSKTSRRRDGESSGRSKGRRSVWRRATSSATRSTEAPRSSARPEPERWPTPAVYTRRIGDPAKRWQGWRTPRNSIPVQSGQRSLRGCLASPHAHAGCCEGNRGMSASPRAGPESVYCGDLRKIATTVISRIFRSIQSDQFST